MELKTIEVHVHKKFMDHDPIRIYIGHCSDNNEHYLNAKLTIEVPDKKITITENELAKAIGSAMDNRETQKLLVKLFGS